jgi:hypothetical protein
MKIDSGHADNLNSQSRIYPEAIGGSHPAAVSGDV